MGGSGGGAGGGGWTPAVEFSLVSDATSMPPPPPRPSKRRAAPSLVEPPRIAPAALSKWRCGRCDINNPHNAEECENCTRPRQSLLLLKQPVSLPPAVAQPVPPAKLRLRRVKEEVPSPKYVAASSPPPAAALHALLPSSPVRVVLAPMQVQSPVDSEKTVPE